VHFDETEDADTEYVGKHKQTRKKYS